VAKLVASDGDYGDSFGYAVAVDGDTAVIGAAYDADNGIGSGSAYIYEMLETAPAPDIKANDSDGPITISTLDSLSVAVTMQAGDFSSTNCDWWCAAQTPWGWYCYDYESNQWIEGLQVTYMGPCANLPTTEILNMTLPQGAFTFYFGVDDIMNGNVDGNLFYDSVNVTVNAGSAPPTRGEWSGIAGFGEIGFVVNAAGNGIEEVTITFKDYLCGAVISNGIQNFFFNPPIPIDNGYIAFDLDLDPPPVDKTLTIEGIFNNIGTSISGNYEADFYDTICTGTFSATPVSLGN
jgi:hypothetical protein